VQSLQKEFHDFKKAGFFVVNALSGFWNSKVSWITRTLGENTRTIVFVRDPRAWIYSLTRQDVSRKQKLRRDHLLKSLLEGSSKSCLYPSRLPPEFQWFSEPRKSSVVEQLSRLWVASVAVMIRQSTNTQIVRFEDVVSDPYFSITEIFKSYKRTVTLPQINRITKAVRSGHTSIKYIGMLHEDVVDVWRGVMTQDEVGIVEGICGNLMKILQYH